MGAAASGMQAQSARLRLSAENVANADTPGYRRKTVPFRAVALPDGGVVTTGRVQIDRRDLPRKFTEDPIQTALLIASTETLDAFASGLATIAENETNVALPQVSDRKGQLPAPVLGRVLRRAGEADAAGITRPGIILATRARALVTSPTAATIRYRGPLLDYGNVIVLEPAAGILMVLAGMQQVYGEIGELLEAGAPVGLMGGAAPTSDDILLNLAEGAGTEASETLYIEIRQDGDTTDPADWFASNKD